MSESILIEAYPPLITDGDPEAEMKCAVVLIGDFRAGAFEPVPGFLEEGMTLRVFLGHALHVPVTRIDDLASGRVGLGCPSSAAFRAASGYY